MKTAIRYFSKFGHTAKMAKVIGELTRIYETAPHGTSQQKRPGEPPEFHIGSTSLKLITIHASFLYATRTWMFSP